MLKCDECKTENCYKLTIVKGKGFCRDCYRGTSRESRVNGRDTMTLGNTGVTITKGEYEEIHRNVLLPGSTNEKRYMGRRMENGKVSDRPIYNG